MCACACVCVEEHILDPRSAEQGLYWPGGRQNDQAFLPSEWGRSLLPFSKSSWGAQCLFPLPGGTGPESLWRRLLGLSPKRHLSFRDMERGSQLLRFRTLPLGQGVVAWIPLRPPCRQRNTGQGSRHSPSPPRLGAQREARRIYILGPATSQENAHGRCEPHLGVLHFFQR